MRPYDDTLMPVHLATTLGTHLRLDSSGLQDVQ